MVQPWRGTRLILMQTDRNLQPHQEQNTQDAVSSDGEVNFDQSGLVLTVPCPVKMTMGKVGWDKPASVAM